MNKVLNLREIESVIEAILFASGEPMHIKDIAKVTGQTENFTKKLINSLIDKYNIDKRGIKIIQIDESFQMCTNPDFFEYIKNLHETPKKKYLSQSLLETLAIVAYRQPITRNGIEDIRGVGSSSAINSLIKNNLIEEKGRLEAIGRPILFGTTNEFLTYFGFSSISDMPNINKGVLKQEE
ncbi:MAG: SMC-Scp complex subunit ScpB [bacterium]